MFDLKLILNKIYHNDIASIDFSSEYCIDYEKMPIITHIDNTGGSNIFDGYPVWRNLISLHKHNYFACNLYDKIYIWNIDAKKYERVINCYSEITALLCLPNGQLLSAHTDKTVKIWQPETGEYLGDFGKFSSFVTSMKLLYDKLATLTDDGVIQYWDIKTKMPLSQTLDINANSINMLNADSNQKIIAANGSYIYYQGLNETIKQKLLSDNLNITASLFDPYDLFICGDDHGSLYIFDLAYIKCKYSLKVSQRTVNSLTILPDGNIIACFDDNIMCVFHPEEGRILQIIKTNSLIRETIVLSDGRIIGAACNGDFYIWQFPIRALNGTDTFLITENLDKNTSVKSLNYTNVILDQYDISWIDELHGKRPDMTIEVG